MTQDRKDEDAGSTIKSVEGRKPFDVLVAILAVASEGASSISKWSVDKVLVSLSVGERDSSFSRSRRSFSKSRGSWEVKIFVGEPSCRGLSSERESSSE